MNLLILGAAFIGGWTLAATLHWTSYVVMPLLLPMRDSDKCANSEVDGQLFIAVAFALCLFLLANRTLTSVALAALLGVGASGIHIILRAKRWRRGLR